MTSTAPGSSDKLSVMLSIMLRECVCLNLRKATRSVTKLYDEALRPIGIRSTQLPLLVAALLRSHTVTSLAEELALDRTTLSRNLPLLERKGWIEIAPGDDRRTREIRLTEEGRDVVRRAVPLWEGAQVRASEALDAMRVEQLLADLQSALRLTRGG